MSKRYWLFSGSRYYPMCGMGDFKKSFDTLEEIYKSGLWAKRDLEWSVIVDTHEEKEVDRI